MTASCFHGLRLTFCAALIGAASLALPGTAFAQGSNVSSPAPAPLTPAPLVTSQQVATIGAATCAQQLNTIGLVAQGTGLGLELGGVIAEGAAQLIPPPGNQVAEGVAIGFQIAGVGAQSAALANSIAAASLPSCDQAFTGTVTVSGGGVNVSGDSIFNQSLGVAGNIAAGGNVTASQVNATQGISAMGGRIFLGDPNGVTFSDGITLGGGALSGAGFGGPQAFTGHLTAIAIGNGASAFSANSIAIGTGARANGTGATALGANSNAAFTNSIAIGPGATTTAPNQVVIGSTEARVAFPSITSPVSRAAQSGPLSLPTTDSAGNLSSDGGATFNAMARVQAGVAIALATSPPHLNPGQRFGVRAGWGGFQGYDSMGNAFGVSAAGLLANGVFSQHDRLTLDAGIAIGQSQFMGYRQNSVVGGRAGLQFTW